MPISQLSTWFTTHNPILNQNDTGQETDTGNVKVGDGLTAWNTLAYYKTSGGYTEATGTNTYVASFAFPGIDAIVEGMEFKVKFLNANTGSSTININGLGAITIKKDGGTNLVSGDIAANQVMLIIFDGTNFQIT